MSASGSMQSRVRWAPRRAGRGAPRGAARQRWRRPCAAGAARAARPPGPGAAAAAARAGRGTPRGPAAAPHAYVGLPLRAARPAPIGPPVWARDVPPHALNEPRACQVARLQQGGLRSRVRSARLGQGGLLQARLVVEQRELVVAAHELRAEQVALAGYQVHLAPLPQPLLRAGRPVTRASPAHTVPAGRAGSPPATRCRGSSCRASVGQPRLPVGPMLRTPCCGGAPGTIRGPN